MPTFFENTQKILTDAARIAHIDPAIFASLKKPEHIRTAELSVKMDNGTEKKFPAWRVQHSSVLGPYKGGIRFHQDSSLDEVQALASLMTWKTSLMGVPYGGGKAAVVVNPKELSAGELERLSRAFVQAFYEYISPEKDIPAPDVNTDGRIMGWMMDEYSKRAGFNVPGSFTGKPIELGGSKGREIATAFGGFVVLREYLKNAHDIRLASGDISVAVQGFGNVGGHIARLLHEAGFKIVALADSKGAVYNPDGINIGALMKMKKGVDSLAQTVGDSCKHITGAELLELEVDVLVPAALENQITEKNATNIKAHIVLELANGPTTADGEAVLVKNGIEVIPDILANGGGVVGSYFEWVQNLQRFYWEEEEVLARIDKIMAEAFYAVMKTKEEFNCTWREAAFVRAIDRVAEVMRLRGRI